MPGPPKRSNAHKKGTGSTKIHVGEDLTPDLLTEIPEPEYPLGEYGMSKWNQMCARLIDEQMLTKWDLEQLLILCKEWERYMMACDDIAINGEFMVYETGHEQVRPSHTIRNKSFMNFTKLADKFGGDVQSRAKMKRVRPQIEEESKFDKI